MKNPEYAISEANFQHNVIRVAQVAGWRIHHSRRAQLRDGTWSTPLGADKGYPDLTMVRGQHLLLVELKSSIGQRSPHQIKWGDALLEAGADYRCWRPKDWVTDIVPTLTRRLK